MKPSRGRDPSPQTASPPPQTKVTIVGKNEIYKRENLVGLFLVQKLLGPRPPPPRSKDALPRAKGHSWGVTIGARLCDRKGTCGPRCTAPAVVAQRFSMIGRPVPKVAKLQPKNRDEPNWGGWGVVQNPHTNRETPPEPQLLGPGESSVIPSPPPLLNTACENFRGSPGERGGTNIFCPNVHTSK